LSRASRTTCTKVEVGTASPYSQVVCCICSWQLLALKSRAGLGLHGPLTGVPLTTARGRWGYWSAAFDPELTWAGPKSRRAANLMT
jgi:hypothetical protein